MANGVTIRVRSYEKFKGRGDVKLNSWFRCSNRLLEDPDFFAFSHAELLVWIYILSLASQKNIDTVFINFDHAERVCRLKKRDVLSALDKLYGIQIDPVPVTSALRGRYAHDTPTCATGQDNTGQDKQNNNAQSGDFADFWSGVPRKIGKSKAAKAYWREIKAGVSHEDLCRARDKYRDHCEVNKTETQFIKHGSTLMNEIHDWLDPDVGQAQNFSETTKANLDDIQFDQEPA